MKTKYDASILGKSFYIYNILSYIQYILHIF